MSDAARRSRTDTKVSRGFVIFFFFFFLPGSLLARRIGVGNLITLKPGHGRLCRHTHAEASSLFEVLLVPSEFCILLTIHTSLLGPGIGFFLFWEEKKKILFCISCPAANTAPKGITSASQVKIILIQQNMMDVFEVCRLCGRLWHFFLKLDRWFALPRALHV